VDERDHPMNKDFLEFWGNLFLNAAHGQKQLEELSGWMQQGMTGAETLTGMFSKFYGLDQLPKDNPNYFELWDKATKDFQNSFTDFINMMGLVSHDEHVALIKKYEKLKKENEDLRETVRHLRLLYEEKGASQEMANQSFKELMVKQSEQFQELMEGFSSFVKENTDATTKQK
jgi:hypothetical protein